VSGGIALSARGVAPQNVGDQLGAAVDVELAENVRHVSFDGLRRNEHALGDLGVGEPLDDELGDFGLGRSERWPAAEWAPTRAATSARPLERVLDAQLGALPEGGFVCLVAERVSQPAIDRRPMLVLMRNAYGAELRSPALGGREQPCRVRVLTASLGDLSKRVEACRDVGDVTTAGTDVQVRAGVLLGCLPVAARGRQTRERQACERAEKAVAEPLALGLRLPRRGFGGSVA